MKKVSRFLGHDSTTLKNGNTIYYTLSISKHCTTDQRYINIHTTEDRMIENMHLKRLNGIVRQKIEQLAHHGRYLLIIHDTFNSKLKHYVLIVSEADRSDENKYLFIVVTMITTNNDLMTFKKIPINNRLLVQQTYQELLADKRLMNEEELYQVSKSAKMVPNPKLRERKGLQIVKKVNK